MDLFRQIQEAISEAFLLFQVIMIKKDRLSLEEMLNKVTPENIHPETSKGGPVGRELW